MKWIISSRLNFCHFLGRRKKVVSRISFLSLSVTDLLLGFQIYNEISHINNLHHSQLDILLDGSLPLCTTSALRSNHRFRFVIPQHVHLTALETPLSTTAVLALPAERGWNSSSVICKLGFIIHLRAFSFHTFVFLSVSIIILIFTIFQRLVCVRTNSLIRRTVTSWSMFLWPSWMEILN